MRSRLRTLPRFRTNTPSSWNSAGVSGRERPSSRTSEAVQFISSGPTTTCSSGTLTLRRSTAGMRAFAWFERLGDVIVRSELESHDPIANGPARRQHHDGHSTAFPHFSADGKAIQVWQHHIEDHDIGRIALKCLETLVGIDSDADLEVESPQISGEEGIEIL